MSHSLRRRGIETAALLAMLLALLTPGLSSAAAKPGLVDFTQGGKRDETIDWNLGATGARGWMWGWKNHTTDARQILITAVAPGSPADMILAPGDVILGVGGKRFFDDARIQFAQALTRAETKTGQGKLRLTRWRAGKTQEVTLALPVLGSYSDTAPYHCEKSQAIFERGCRAIAKKGLGKVSLPNDFNALALLASGNKTYLPLVKAYARNVATTLNGRQWWWHYAYGTLVLGEYILATGDRSLLPALRTHAREIARFQSNVGTWGHGHKLTEGRLPGYGAMNQIGLPLTVSLVVAQKAGVKDPLVARAIEKAASFVRWYVGKGSVPYGDHMPWMDHGDNGKNAEAAVLYDLLGDEKAATFFSRMATAAFAERENGHTGPFFNVTWGLLGVSRAGANATGAYWKEQAWYYDLARRWDGSFVHHGIPGHRGNVYQNWDCTGAFLLSYALSRKSLALTGRFPGVAHKMSRKEAASVIDDGRDFTFWLGKNAYDHLADKQLLRRLSSWSPIVRVRAARSLAHHKGDYTARLIQMVKAGDRLTQYGALEALEQLGPRASASVSTLVGLFDSDDPWLVSLAVRAISRFDEKTRERVTPELLKLATRDCPNDPRRWVQRWVAKALFTRPRGGGKGPFFDSLAYRDPKALRAAVERILANEDGRTRAALVTAIRNIKTDEKLAIYLPAILAATRDSAPSGIMFADNIRMAGLDLLSRMRIREGMAMCVEQMDPDRWGQGRRIPKCLASLTRYGGNAKPLLGDVKAIRERIRKKRGDAKRKADLLAKFDATIAAIKADKNKPTLRSAADVMGK